MTSQWKPTQARWIVALSLTVALGLCALSGIVIFELRTDTWTAARAAAMNLNRAVGQDIRRTIGTLDLALQAVAERLAQEDTTSLERALHTPLFDRPATGGHLDAVLVTDAGGEVLGDTGNTAIPHGTSFADCDYFRVQRDDPDAGLFISRPFESRTGQQQMVALSRRWTRPDGGFGGIVVATLRLDYFRDSFASLALGPGGRITLFRDDGIALMRLPEAGGAIGSDFSRGTAFQAIPTATEGSYRSLSSRDKVERYYVFKRIGALPLILNVGLSIQDIEAGWRRRASTIGGITLALNAALLAATWLLRRELVGRLAAETAARDSEAGFRLLAENTGDMVSRITSDGIRTYVSPAATRILGREPAELVGRPAREGIHKEDLPQLADAVALLRSRQAEEAAVTYRCWRADGTEIWLESTLRTVVDRVTGKLDGVVAVSRDVTERKAMETRLARLARLDGLTGVANRRAFDEALGREWARCLRAEAPLSIVMIDVDRFKAFNDHYGHLGGDACLRAVAATLEATSRRTADLVARFGGEEFALLLPDTDAEGAAAVGERLRQEIEALQLPHRGLDAEPAVVTVSVGVATLTVSARGKASGPELLIEAADRALYAAKQAGRNRVMLAGRIDPLEPVEAQ